jgi:hypothetical protein
VPGPVQPERDKLSDLGAHRRVPAQVREPGLVRREAGAVRPQRKEQHPGEPLVALGQVLVRRPSGSASRVYASVRSCSCHWAGSTNRSAVGVAGVDPLIIDGRAPLQVRLPRREAGFSTPPSGPDDAALLRRIAALAHVDDAE